jgi:hypothetical protein
MRRARGVLLLGCIVAGGLGLGTTASAQVGASTTPLVLNGTASYYQPPGQYGTSYGVPSFGVPRYYTAFSSPYGAGYGYGYGPYVSALNWYYLNGALKPDRPPYTVPGYFYGGSTYNTFPVPYRIYGPEGPPIGVYAPAFGPPIQAIR